MRHIFSFCFSVTSQETLAQKSCWLTRGVSPSMWLITSFKTVLKSQLVMSFDKTLEMVTLNTCVQKYFSGKGSEKHCLFFREITRIKKKLLLFSSPELIVIQFFRESTWIKTVLICQTLEMATLNKYKCVKKYCRKRNWKVWEYESWI